MARVLGLSFNYHDSAAAVVIDGHIIGAVAEERLCRRKHTNEFPRRAIEFCLEAADLQSVNELDAIVFYEKPVAKFDRIVESLVQVWPRGARAFTKQIPRFLSDKFNVHRTIAKRLPAYQGPIYFTEHHQSHASSAFYCSPFDEAAVLVMDGIGEWESTSVGVGRRSRIDLHRSIHFPHSIGLLYSALTSYLGFEVNDGEWKVMGLAPYGKPTYLQPFRELVDIRDDGSFALNMEYFVHQYHGEWMASHDAWESLFGFPRREPEAALGEKHRDLARSGQSIIEEMILGTAREARRLSGSDNLVIAGGVGLNSVANWRIEKEGLFRQIWIQPATGDDGGAIGAALTLSQEFFGDSRTPELKHTYLGPEYSDQEIRDFLLGNEIPHTELSEGELVDAIADRIGSGQIVGWFQGRMEFGPRALGARSILADPSRPDMKAIVNARIKYREEFRPFAPSVPFERVHEYFDVAPGTALPFMAKVPRVLESAAALIPAVTHVDGSARVQTVRRDDAPLYHALLQAVESRTGVPVLLNTSFNVRGEPIVCSPADAMSCFLHAGLDALAMGRFLVDKQHAAGVTSEGREQTRTTAATHEENEQSVASGSLVSQSFTMRAAARTVPATTTVLTGTPADAESAETTRKVLNFYREMPFNYYSNAVDTAYELQRANRIKVYRPVHRHLSRHEGVRLLDVGCGGGWFVNSCARYYDVRPTGIDLNPVVLKQARAVARLMAGGTKTRFIHADVMEFEPDAPFDLVNSLGVLHSTPDCHGAIRRVLTWIAPGGFLHLGLYHLYGRRPFLRHFAYLQAQGASDEELYVEYRRLHSNVTDETHLLSWFRDQVLHPHETQHTYEEIDTLLNEEGFVIESTSINGFRRLPSRKRIIAIEKECERISRRALYKHHRYYPGFFSIWARRRG